MKLFISADIEGICGIADWNETDKKHPEYEYFRKEMSKEVAAVCRTALQNDRVEEVLVRDAHGTAENIIPDMLPKGAGLLRGWEGTPGNMMTGVENCDAVMMIGYHSGAGMAGTPLAHTKNRENYRVMINGEIASEFLINAYHAAYYHIPVLMISGDELICREAGRWIPNIRQAAVHKGMGGAVLSMNPADAQELLCKETEQALGMDLSDCQLELPETFEVKIEFMQQEKAIRGGYYPGAEQTEEKTDEK